MRRLIFIFLGFLMFFPLSGQDLSGKMFALYQFPIDFEIQNDQGEMDTGEYLKEYGTRRKTRAVETMYEIMVPYVVDRLSRVGVNLLPCDEMADIKSNPYGVPNMMINKAVKSCDKADYFLRIAIKDITVINPNIPTDNLSVKTRTITVRCRISVTDRDKNTIKDLEGVFDSSEKIPAHRDIGFDILKIRGPERDQEIKVYEACCKMAFLRAMDKW
jgi:hypothetical protein